MNIMKKLDDAQDMYGMASGGGKHCTVMGVRFI